MIKLGRKRIDLAIMAICILVVSGLSGCFEGKNGKTVIWTAHELINDYIYGEDPKTFESLDPGDTVKIKDTIEAIYSEYNRAFGKTTTNISFLSTKNVSYEGYTSPYYFTFEGDLTQDFAVGEKVIVTLHIIEVEEEPGGEHIETFKEVVWGKGLLIPRSAIELSLT